MPLEFREKIKKILPPKKILAGLVLISLICLAGLIIVRNKPSFWWSLIFDNPIKQTDNRTNFLLLGVAGGNNAGADLTDTMIFASLNQKTGKVTLVSLPRDLWSSSLAAKINTAYHYGEEKKIGGGLSLAKSTVEEIVNLPIHYVIKIDMAGLKEVIDLLGGVEVNIETAFDDDKFPIAGKEDDSCGNDPEYRCRYTRIHFDQGPQLLDGEKALQYIRSREAESEEGTDFARSKRQQKLMLALKDKMLSLTLLRQPEKIIKLNQLLVQILETDIPSSDFPYLAKMLIKINYNQATTLNLEKFLVNPPTWQYEGQWILVPRSGDFSEIQNYLKEQILK